jgi:tetratricopeptide (TPR) repeat protein
VVVALAPLAVVGCGFGRSARLADDLDSMHPERRFREAMRLTRLAENARDEGDTPRAIAYYRAAVRTSPDLWIAQNNLGLMLLETSDAHLGAKHLLRAAEIEPTDPRPLTNLGWAYWQRDWPAEALRYFDMAVDRAPNDLGALRGAIRAAESQGRAQPTDLERVLRASFIETERRWIEYFQRQKYRIENQIRLQRRDTRGLPEYGTEDTISPAAPPLDQPGR